MEEQLERFAEIAKSEGYITIDDLAQYLNVPVSPALQEMFTLYDRVSFLLAQLYKKCLHSMTGWVSC